MVSPANLKNDYRIGIITALPIELAAITAMLDTEYKKPDDFEQHFQDPNSYTWGRIGQHNIVIATLAAGVYGNTMATTTAMPLLYSFPNVKFGLMVGIGAGIPARNVRLGDVVVSQPDGISGGVFQYDLGRAMHNEWERKDLLARPPDILLKALNTLQAKHEFRAPRAHEYLRGAITKWQIWGNSFDHPKKDDCLYNSSYIHHVDSLEDTCSACDPSEIIKRPQRPPHTQFKIHYGVIASGNSLVKDAKLRDWIASMERRCFCIEMEAAGLMNNFPCLVIRGICDYADTHKNDVWQRYACATAAAFSKELLSFVPVTESETAIKATEVLKVPTSKPLNLPLRAGNGSQHNYESSLSESSNGPKKTKLESSLLELPSESVNSTTSAQNSSSTPNSTSPKSTSAPANSIINPEIKETSKSSRYSFLTRQTVNTRSGRYGETLLGSAAREGDVEAVASLIECGADIELPNGEGFAPIHIAARHGHFTVVKLLIGQKANIEGTGNGATPLHTAAFNGHMNVVRLLIEHKANIEATISKNGFTSLILAAQKGHLDVVKFLIEHKANVEAATTKRGFTPLYVAVQNGHVDVVKLLIDQNANIEAIGSSGYTLLCLAVHNGHLDVVKLLIEHGANIGAATGYGVTPLYEAALNGHSKLVKLLIEHQANIEAISIDGCTPLYAAAWKGHLFVAMLLIEYGANIEATTIDGCTPLYAAAREGHLHVVELLIEHKANIEALDIGESSALRAAVEDGHLDIVRVLIKNGANMGSIVDLAQEKGHEEIIKELEDHNFNEILER